MPAKTEVLKQIDAILSKYRDLRARSTYDDCSDQPAQLRIPVAALMSDAVKRLAPRESQYEESRQLMMRVGVENATVLPPLAGILEALRTAYDADYLTTTAELIHADLFADFLEMASYLLEQGYKDPAAVICGSVLEEHLRKLCDKQGIPVLKPDSSPKKADALNADLASAGIYSKLDQKSVTAWLDLRNKAAHGKYSEYVKEQVTLMLQGVRDFASRFPA